MPGRCSLSSSCSTGVMPCEASVDTAPVRHTFLKFAAPNSWRLWTYHAQVWMPGDAANSACGSQKVGISTDGRAPRNSLESPQTPAALAKRRMSAVDAVDGSSTGTRVPWMWALLRLPRFGGAIHADDHDNRVRHRQVGLPGPRS